MAGYRWHPILRTVPTDGPPETIDILQEFLADCGPNAVRAAHPPDIDRREDINRDLADLLNGYRPTARLVFDVVKLSNHEVITKILERAASPIWTLFLSLDGGESEREVVLRRYTGPRGLGGKTLAGARYELEFHAVSLADTVPAINGGVW